MPLCWPAPLQLWVPRRVAPVRWSLSCWVLGGGLGSRLVALERYQPYFVAATLAFLGFAFYRLYVRPARCAPGDACAIPATRKRQKAIFWVVSVLAVGLMSSPLYAPLFY